MGIGGIIGSGARVGLMGSAGGMFGFGATIHFGAFGVLSEFHARKVTKIVPTMLPKKHVKAAHIRMMKGASPMMMTSK